MKYLSSEFGFLFSAGETRANLTGLSVVAVDAGSSLITQLTADTVLPKRATLLMLGSAGQRQQFAEQFEKGGR